MNISKVVIFLLIVMIVAFGLAAITGGTTAPWRIEQGNLENIDQTFDFNVADIRDIDIKTISTDIHIIPTNDTSITAHLYGSATEGLINKEFAQQSGSRIYINVSPKPGMNINARLNLTLDIYVPSTYQDNIRADTVSGQLDAADLTLDSLRFNSVSGNIWLRGIRTEHIKVNTTSGDLKADGLTGDIDASSVSGKLVAEYSEFANNISFNTTSGDVDLTLPADATFGVRLQTVSGKVKSDFPILVISTSGRNFEGVVGNDDNRIEAHSVSGSINIKKR